MNDSLTKMLKSNRTIDESKIDLFKAASFQKSKR